MSAYPVTVPVMNLEARVTAVEVGLAAVREVEIPALRAEVEQKFSDLRAETRGWAEFTVQTANKVDAATEIINLIYADVRTTKEDVAVLKSDMVEVKADVAVLKTDVAGLKSDMVEVKTDVAGLKADVGELKADVAGLKADVGELKTGQKAMERQLTGHGEILQKILAKLS
jgi:chromosome segregation ATPase